MKVKPTAKAINEIKEFRNSEGYKLLVSYLSSNLGIYGEDSSSDIPHINSEINGGIKAVAKIKRLMSNAHKVLSIKDKEENQLEFSFNPSIRKSSIQ